MDEIYAIYDTTAKNYLKPFHCKNRGEALRLAETWVNDESKGNIVNQYPTQFVLMFLGTWCPQSGQYTTDQAEEVIIMSALVKEPNDTLSNHIQKLIDYLEGRKVTDIREAKIQ